MLDSIIQTTLDSFDFSFCITVNVLTYLIIKCFSESKLKIKMTTWRKRLILIMAILVIGITLRPREQSSTEDTTVLKAIMTDYAAINGNIRMFDVHIPKDATSVDDLKFYIELRSI